MFVSLFLVSCVFSIFMSTINQAYAKAIEILFACTKKQGFYASGLPGGYEATWARDSMITSLGASLVGDKFKKPFKNSLDLLTANQTERGLIPNCVGSYNTERQSDVTFNSIDAPQWYILGHYVYARAYRDHGLIAAHKDNIDRALSWLLYQDPNEDKLIVQQPTMDWMDAFPHKYGRVLHTQALEYAVLRATGNNELAAHIKSIVNGEIQKYLSLWDARLGYYRPWIWKDHDGDRETEDWFDCLANLLAIITGLATDKIAKSILRYIEKNKIDRPYPCKTIWPPLKKGDPGWHTYFEKCDARRPLEYSNAGIWPMIGAFYVVALVKMKKFKKAGQELERLAEGNLKKLITRDFCEGYEFNEWLHGKSGEPKGEPYQAWSAGTYIYAYECVKRKKVIFF